MLRSRDSARLAALRAEVVAMRATVAELRGQLDATLARQAELNAQNSQLADELDAARASLPVEPVVVPEPEAPAAPALQLPLVRLALAREVEPALTREMALALTAPDRGEDTAATEIVLRDLPEGELLDPKADRDSAPVDHAPVRPADEDAARRIA
ncbi:MAG: hypothetical protein ACRDWY_10210 [Actinomycetes bacterium]